MEKQTCIKCNKEFTRNWIQLHCSISCSKKGNKLSLAHRKNIAKGLIGVRKGIPGKKWSAETREKMIPILIGRKWKEESKNKIKGSNHYRWIKDRNNLKTEREKAYDTKYKYWMLEVKKRDNWACRIADNNCEGRLEAHHILNWKEYPELRYEINNGITLCHAHHPRGRANEKRLSPYFMELVSVSKE